MSARRSRSGLTLREVVLSAAAVLLLALLCLALFRQKGRDALRAESARNLMQWSIALQIHILENNGHLPAAGPRDASPNADGAWYLTLADYLGIPSPVRDPSLVESGLKGPLRIWRDPSFRPPLRDAGGRFVFTYGVNRYLQPDTSLPAFRIRDLVQPAHTIFMVEKDGADPGALPPDARFRHTRKGHRPAAHVLYCDGHVALVDDAALLAFPDWPQDAAQAGSPTIWPPFPDAPEPEW